jgi:hypothetical protein
MYVLIYGYAGNTGAIGFYVLRYAFNMGRKCFFFERFRFKLRYFANIDVKLLGVNLHIVATNGTEVIGVIVTTGAPYTVFSIIQLSAASFSDFAFFFFFFFFFFFDILGQCDYRKSKCWFTKHVYNGWYRSWNTKFRRLADCSKFEGLTVYFFIYFIFDIKIYSRLDFKHYV